MKAWLRRRALRRKINGLCADYQYFRELEHVTPSASVRAIAKEDAARVLSRIAENLWLGDRL